MIFTTGCAAKWTISIHTLFILVHVLFYVFFLLTYASNREPVLRVGSILAIIGSSLIAFLYLKKIFLVFGMDFIPRSLQNQFFDVIIPPASSLCSLVFFGIFKKVQSEEEYRVLNRSITWAMIGIGLFAAVHVMVLIHFLKPETFMGSERMSRALASVTLPFMVLAAVLLICFYTRFYQFLCSRSARNHGPGE